MNAGKASQPKAFEKPKALKVLSIVTQQLTDALALIEVTNEVLEHNGAIAQETTVLHVAIRNLKMVNDSLARLYALLAAEGSEPADAATAEDAKLAGGAP